MVGTTVIKSLLSSVTANVYGLHVPNRRGSKWVIVTQISDIPHRTKDGVSTLDRYRFQIDSYAMTESAMDTLAGSVKSTLDDYSGTVGSTEVDLIVFEDENDSIEVLEDRDGGGEDYYRRRQDYTIWIKP